MKSQSFIPLLLLISLTYIFEFNGVDAIVGAYKPIKDLNDPLVQELAKFAVEEHNKEAKTQLVYDHLVKGQIQVVAGTNYKFVIAVKEPNAHLFEALVFESLDGAKKLVSFKDLNPGF